jgi:hypothetical protein
MGLNCELCQAEFRGKSRVRYQESIRELADEKAESVILDCTLAKKSCGPASLNRQMVVQFSFRPVFPPRSSIR